MSGRLGAADAALKAGRRDEAIDLIVSEVEDEPNQPVGVYRALVTQCYLTGRYQQGAEWAARAAERHPRDLEIANVRGVLLRRLGQLEKSLEVLEGAIKLDPKSEGPQLNRCNVLLDLGRFARAEEGLTKLVRKQPRNAEYQRMLGRALRGQGKLDAGLTRFRQAVAIRRDYLEAWLDLAGVYNDQNRTADSEEALDKALAALPGEPRLLEAKAMVLRRAGQLRRAEAFLQGLLPQFPDAAWLEFQLGVTIAEYDRDRANVHLRRAVALAPESDDYRIGLIESLDRTRTGDEGANVEEAYRLAKDLLERGAAPSRAGAKKVLFEVVGRVGDFEGLAKVGDFRSLGRLWAESWQHTALLKLLAHVKTLEDRYELLEQHRIWGRLAERAAAQTPIRTPPPRARDGKIRLGLLSSDLRRHPVGYFALPLFEHVDERFELYCYSFYQGQEDDVQKFMASKSRAYRWNPEISARDAAQIIADDQLDMLIELGGSTHMNKPDVMAYRPARKQASWLGYPHSVGISKIDYLVCDPQTAPPRRDLLVEHPLLMPHSWIALGRMVFSENHVIEPGLPEDRAGAITFGTANNPHKYNPELLAAWARVLAATPGSRFMFIRPEGGSESFRRNMTAAFAKRGIDPERIIFRTVRGRHMPHYNEVDISLDTFPLTGGTTTTEALWMGVPVVSLIGEAFFERLSHSILANAGAADLATDDPARFTEIAVALAADRARRLELRHSLRERMKSGPLGQTGRFAGDFYDMIARAVEGEAAAAAV